MATVTIVEGSTEELRGLFPNLFHIALGAAPAPADTKTDRPWSFEEFTKYWYSIKPEARRFLKELSYQPGGCYAGVFKEKFGWSYKELAGKLTSLKFQLKHFPHKPMVYGRDQTIGYSGGYTYVMEIYIAEYIAQLPNDSD